MLLRLLYVSVCVFVIQIFKKKLSAACSSTLTYAFQGTHSGVISWLMQFLSPSALKGNSTDSERSRNTMQIT